ncbi:hypothetical protein AIOL_002428 [Candidatus Rhodobacter oscarellae]|uniref:Calcineurin-like phosphoesterase domain-containing protein n=2 Tax=Candidatus Rhodobacter oscarellae TaxID=1675527 RepID=A0A0J9GV61_9RHOB|nr:hypothetical protein AIOL_002428 [Candidatus Rhodobacter lobularis]
MLRIAILSDIHWGFAPMSAARMEAVKRRVAALCPDLVVFLGDLAGGHGKPRVQANVAAGAEALKGLSAPLGAFAVLGNHDWHDDPAAQARKAGPVAAQAHLEAAGFTFLENQAQRPGRDDIWLAGITSQQAIKGRSWWRKERAGRDDLEAALRQAPGDDPIVLLAHEPDIFPDIADPRVVLTLSGHTHAGQLRLFGRALYAPSRHGTRYAYGHFEERGRHLVVSAGLGASSIPLRIGTVPEITLVEIAGPST